MIYFSTLIIKVNIINNYKRILGDKLDVNKKFNT